MAPLWTEPIKKIASHNNHFFNRLPEQKSRVAGAKKNQGRGRKKHFKKFKIILKFAPDEKDI